MAPPCTNHEKTKPLPGLLNAAECMCLNGSLLRRLQSHASWWSRLNANAERQSSSSPQLEHCCRLPRLLSFCTSGGYRTGQSWTNRLFILMFFSLVTDKTRTCLLARTIARTNKLHHVSPRARTHTHATWALYLSKVARSASTYLACLCLCVCVRARAHVT